MEILGRSDSITEIVCYPRWDFVSYEHCEHRHDGPQDENTFICPYYYRKDKEIIARDYSIKKYGSSFS